MAMLARRVVTSLPTPLRQRRLPRTALRHAKRHFCSHEPDYRLLLQASLAVQKDQRARSAWRALLKPHSEREEGESGEHLFLQPEEFIRLLDSVALCPAISDELYAPGGPLDTKLFCSQDAFQGSPERQHYFRHHMLRLHREKASVINRAFHSLQGNDDRDDLAFHAFLSLEADTSEGTDADNVTELKAEREEDADDGEDADGGEESFSSQSTDGEFAEFLVESESANFLAACSKQDIFLARSVQGDSASTREGSWYLGIAQDIKAPQGSLVSLLQLHLHALEPRGDGGLGSHGQCFEMVPISFLPKVFELECAAVLDLCYANPRFTEFIQGLVFPNSPSDSTDGDGETTQDVLDCGTLNAQQALALHVAVAAQKRLTLIQGPPGTGKTEVAVAIVEAWRKQDTETPIFVATGTHASKNLISERLQQRGTRLSDRFKKNKKRADLTKKVTPIFVETVYMAASPKDRKLPRVLIDESSQITETAGLIAVGQSCAQLVLIGDPQQLGPISQHEQAKDSECPNTRQECDSLFQAMQLRHALEPIMLEEQYRMDPLLCVYPSTRFYCGRLVTHPSLAERQLPDWHPLRLPLLGDLAEPGIFVDTAEIEGEGRRDESVPFQGARSLRNPCEVRLVLHIVQLLQACGVPSRSISLVTGYSAQRDYLAYLLHGTSPCDRLWRKRQAHKLLHGVDLLEQEPHPRVYTVNGFQGSENEIIVYSTVRSNAQLQTGFAGNPQRVCVSLTRARHVLIVVGDSSTLQHDPEWGSWIKEAPLRTARVTQDVLESVKM